MNHCMTISSDDVLWDYYIEKLPEKKQDIYYRKKYYSLNEAITSGEAELFVYEEDDNLGVYPYIKRKIDLLTDEYPYYDIETAYGYGGPILKNELPGNPKKAEYFLVPPIFLQNLGCSRS